jgi:hypothetical protein
MEMASYTLVTYGIGDVLGGMIVGYVNDHYGGGVKVAKVNMLL